MTLEPEYCLQTGRDLARCVLLLFIVGLGILSAVHQLRKEATGEEEACAGACVPLGC